MPARDPGRSAVSTVRRLRCGADELLLLSWPVAPARRAAVSERLTAAERAVLAGVVRGEGNAEIARLRGASVRTVANQVARVLRKLGATSRFELIARHVAEAAVDAAARAEARSP